MIVTRELRIQGLLHDDFFVRDPVLDTFQGGLDSGVDVTKTAIEAIARYGWDGAFEWPHMITRLAHDQDTIEWLFQQLSDRSHRGPNANTRLHLAKWFSEAELELIRPNLNRLQAAFQGRDAGEGHFGLSKFLQAARERIQFASETDDQCLARLEGVFTECQKAKNFPHSALMRAERLCERFARNGDRTRLAKLVSQWLDVDSELTGDIAEWRAGIAIRLAALLRQRKTVPRLLEMFDADWDWWNEEIEKALAVMSDEESVLSHITREFAELPEHARLYTSGALSNARAAGTERHLTGLLETETDDRVRINLGKALALCGTASSIEAARCLFEEYAADPDAFEIAETLYAFYRILGADDRSELPGWRRTLQAMHSNSKAINAALN